MELGLGVWRERRRESIYSSYCGQQAGFQPRNDVISFIFRSSPVWRMDLREKDRAEDGDLV